MSPEPERCSRSAPASGAVSRASRLTQVLEIDPPFGDCHAADVRREAHRTTPGAGVLPRKTNCIVPAEASSPSLRNGAASPKIIARLDGNRRVQNFE
jgi:hypothetical protein